MNFVPNAVDVFSEWTAKVTTQFIKTYIGKIFLAIVLVGPITFLPTMYQAWTAPDIDALRTSTWPLMILVNIYGGKNKIFTKKQLVKKHISSKKKGIKIYYKN